MSLGGPTKPFSNSIQREIIFNFIDQIHKEVSCYSISAINEQINEIESQLQAQRMEKILTSCIQHIELTFHLPNLLAIDPDFIRSFKWMEGIERLIYESGDVMGTQKQFQSVFCRALISLDQHFLVEALQKFNCEVFQKMKKV